MGSIIHLANLKLADDYIVKVEEGGMAGTNPIDSLNNINALSMNEFLSRNTNGPIVLDSNGKISATYIGVQNIEVTVKVNGPSEAPISTTIEYVITNHSDFSNYVISVDKGTVTINKDTVIINTPPTPGIINLTINNRSIPINVYSVRTKPTLTSSKVGNLYTLTGSSYIPVDGSDTHIESHWEIASDNNFNNIISGDYNSNKLTSLTYRTDLTTLFARVAYVGSKNVVTGWSDGVQI